MTRRRWTCLTCLSVACLLGLSSCAPTPVADPLGVMSDRSRDPAQRIAAAEQLGPIGASSDPKAAASAMHRVLWSDAQPTDLRLMAMVRLIEYDADDFWRVSETRILQVDLWPVLGPLIDKAAERGDASFTLALVRSYARASRIYPDDRDRPERAAIEALNPGETVEQAVWGVFASADSAVSAAGRVDAWSLLNRLVGPEKARSLLADADASQAVMRDLKESLWLGVLPTNRESVLWLLRVRGLDDGAYWERARHKADDLTEEQRQGLALRHLPAILGADETDLARGKRESLARLTSVLSRAELSRRTQAGNMRELPSESLNDHADQLCWADLLVIRRLLDALDDPLTTRAFFGQADADMADTTTEHGGVIAYESGRFSVIDFPPILRMHDRAFHASDALINRLYTALAHYHFHAQQYNNAEYAGPGPGDLAFVENLQAAAVVFTFLDRDTLGVDYYQPGGVIADLGVIRR